MFKKDAFGRQVSDFRNGGGRSDRYIRWCLTIIAFTSFGNFSDKLLPGNALVGSFLPQQFMALFVWFLMALLLVVRRTDYSRLPPRLVFPLILILYVVVSPGWGEDVVVGFAKTVLLLFVTLVVWRLSLFVSVDVFFSCVWTALAISVFASAVVAVAMPSIGVLDDWNHAGQWAGIFQTKQDLGFASATLIYLTALRLAKRVKTADVLVLIVALACVLQSGSRGGAAESLLAVALVFFGLKVKGVNKFLSASPIFFSAIGFANVVFLALSGLTYYPVMGEEVDLSSRTFIWNFALSQWLDRFWVGFGVNQFWNIQDNVDRFTSLYGWFLDNYHSGYVAIAVELGFVGMLLFWAASVSLSRSLYRVLQRGAIGIGKLEGLGLCGMLFLIYLINLTETYFLRSTNFYQVILTFIFVKLGYLSLARNRAQ